MSSVVSGVGKAVSGIVKGVGKVFKAVTSSSIGRIALLGAAIWLGGGALGFWPSPIEAISGAFAGGGAAAAEAAAPSAAAEMLGGEAVGEAVGAAAPAAESLGGVMNTHLAQAAGDTMIDAGVEGIGEVAPMAEKGIGINALLSEGGATDMGVGLDQIRNLAPGGGQEGPGFLSQAAKQIAEFYKGDMSKAMLTAQVGNAVAKGFTPNPVNEQLRLEQERMRRIQPNYAVGNVAMPQPAQPAVLLDSSGKPVFINAGVMNSAVR